MPLSGDDIVGIAFAVAMGCLIASDDGAFAVKTKADPMPGLPTPASQTQAAKDDASAKHIPVFVPGR